MNVSQTVIDIIKEQFGDNKVTLETHKDDLGMDSLDQVEFIMNVENEFDLDTIADEDAENFNTVQDVVDYVLQRV